MIYDISITVAPDMVTWENSEQGLSLEWSAQIGKESVCNVSNIQGGMHTGTHLDAPLHFLDDGGTVADLDLEDMVGPAQVVEITGSGHLTADRLAAAEIGPDTRRVIFITDNTSRGLLLEKSFYADYIAIAPSGAQWLVDHHIRLVGVDYLSVGPYGPDNTITHRILLGSGIVVVEGLNLTGVRPGNYTLAALPPKIQGAEEVLAAQFYGINNLLEGI